MVFQNPEDQLVAARVENDVAFGLQNLGLPRPTIRARVEEALALLGIADLYGRSVFELSAGQQQKVALAGVLAMRPQVLILDEPTSQLDPQSAADLLDAVTRLHKQDGMTVILVEHRLHMVAPVASRLIVVADGQVVADGPPRSILAQPTMEDYGISVPWPARLALSLQDGRMIWDPLPLTVEELAAQLVDRWGSERTQEIAGLPEEEEQRGNQETLPSQGEAIIVFDHVTHIQPNGLMALNDVSLTIRRGESLAIMGGVGAGKTTLVKHMNGLLKPTTGRVLVHGVDTRGTSVAALARFIGFVFQNPLSQLFASRVEEEIALSCQGEPHRVERVLQQFCLMDYRTRHPLSLSEGQKKRVALAATLAMDPEVLILDEPTLGQDALEKNSLLALLRDFHARGGTTVLVTHDLDVAVAACTRVLLMDNGGIIMDGPTAEVMRHEAALRQACLLPAPLPRLSKLLRPYGINLPSLVRAHAMGSPIREGCP